MINLDDESAQEFLAECHEHLATIETDLLDIEGGGAEIDEELVNRVFRAVHSVEGGAGVFDLVKICDLAHQTGDVLALIRSRKAVATPERVRVLLRAIDRLRELTENPGASNQADVAEIMAALASQCVEHQASAGKYGDSAAGQAQPGRKQLRVLLVEDDFSSRLVLQIFLSRYGECHVAVNGREGVEAFRYSVERGQRYDLICMDIMMPEMNGREAVRRIRELEEARGIRLNTGAKIVMTTAVDDLKEVFQCFKELCDAYLVKPIDLTKLLSLMKSYQMVQ
jgi:two-component system, chemotaxis family, chemotaxis protein CheY